MSLNDKFDFFFLDNTFCTWSFNKVACYRISLFPRNNLVSYRDNEDLMCSVGERPGHSEGESSVLLCPRAILG